MEIGGFLVNLQGTGTPIFFIIVIIQGVMELGEGGSEWLYALNSN